MMEDQNFLSVMTLIGEPARARMLWNLLDGRAYTAGELAMEANVSATSASNHLSKLLEADLLKVSVQGRHRYYSFSRPEVAYVVESLASLANHDVKKIKDSKTEIAGIKYCRTCYDHLAGYVGVRFTEGLETNGLIKNSNLVYTITGKGWKWLADFGIYKDELDNKRRPLTKQCIDWSERQPHLAGQIGALLLGKMLERAWFRKIKFSRELIVTAKGSTEIYNLLNIKV